MFFVTGHLIYQAKTYDQILTPETVITLEYKRKQISNPLKNFGESGIRLLLTNAGIPATDIRTVLFAWDKDSVEVFFVYESNDYSHPDYYDVSLITKAPFKERMFSHYAAKKAIIIPQFKLLKPDWAAIIQYLTTRYAVYSFMVKPVAIPTLPQDILDKQPLNGVMADMRNLSGSYIYVPKFKQLNWKTIWYQNEKNQQLRLERPKTGWTI